MFVLRVSTDPEVEGGIADLDVPILARLQGPLALLKEIDGIEGVYPAPDGRSAFVPRRCGGRPRFACSRGWRPLARGRDHWSRWHSGPRGGLRLHATRRG